MWAVTEIGRFGRGSIPAACRTRAALEGPIPVLSSHRGGTAGAGARAAAVRTIEATLAEPEDRSRAGAGAFQGLERN